MYDSPDEIDTPDIKITPTATTSSCKMANLVLAETCEEAHQTEMGESTPYIFLCKAFLHISNHSGRLECILKLARAFHTIMQHCQADLVPAMYLTLNKVAPDQEGIELGVGDAILVKAVADGCGNTVNHVKEQYKKSGDLAEVAQFAKKGVMTLCKSKPLTIRQVFATFYDIATKSSGKDAQKFRQEKITRLLQRSMGIESNFIVRALQGKMRIGMAVQSVLAAFAYALLFAEHPNYRSMKPEVLQHELNRVSEGVQSKYHLIPSLSHIVPKFLAEGLSILNSDSLSIIPFVALKPMLASPENGVHGVFHRVGTRKMSCEFKYDGERAQIHFERKPGASEKPPQSACKVQIYSRNSENNTTKYPDIVASLESCIHPSVQSCILDGEVVAIDPSTGQIQSFQHLQHRARKDVRLDAVEIPVCVVLFDIIFLNGKSLINQSLRERRNILFSSGKFQEVPGKWKFVEFIDTNDAAEIDEFFQKSVAFGCEGLIVKVLDEGADYIPCKRSFSWLKLKKDYMEGLVDTLDLVPIGAYYGKGKRTGVFGGFLLACYDTETESFQSICKLGTGFTDEQLESLSSSLGDIIRAEAMPFYRYDAKDEPDVWLDPSRVWEVKAADLSLSPRHYAGFDAVAPGKGIALRFPRFIRQREDKSVADSTDSQQVVHMFQQQAVSSMTDTLDGFEKSQAGADDTQL
ncbi:DNA ligase I [Perkinsela sp. CCAP 1560/4]|nr:DNA ligase I [Perkinsela sp. CCAP 1560/4]|eukprot:KNH09116.1 DNA ligase I [Perkinsela sp. CCAP 1560/4]